MAFNAPALANARYTRQQAFSNKTTDELITTYGSLENARKAALLADSEEILNHIHSAGVINVNVATTGTAAAHTGTGTGTIS